jgi:hypothetical protein
MVKDTWTNLFEVCSVTLSKYVGALQIKGLGIDKLTEEGHWSY